MPVSAALGARVLALAGRRPDFRDWCRKRTPAERIRTWFRGRIWYVDCNLSRPRDVIQSSARPRMPGANRVQLRLQRLGGCARRGARGGGGIRGRLSVPRQPGPAPARAGDLPATLAGTLCPTPQSCLKGISPERRAGRSVLPAPTRLNGRHANPLTLESSERRPQSLDLARLSVPDLAPADHYHRGCPDPGGTPHVPPGGACAFQGKVRT